MEDLHVRAVAFDDGQNRAVVISLEILELEQKYFDGLIDAVHQGTGIQKDAIFINCSHTHTGPLVGNRICQASPFEHTILCSLTNGEGTYIPTKESYAEGGYEARSSVIKPGGDNIIVEGMAELLKELK